MTPTLRSVAAAAAATLLALPAFAAEPKRVIVCTVTAGFRHSSIPTAEKTLQKLADESKAFTIVDYARQPEVQLLKKPNRPKDLKPDADEKARANHDKDVKKYTEEMAAWTPEKEARAKDAQTQYDTAVRQSLDKLSPENLKSQRIDGVIFANTTGDLALPDKDGFIKWIAEGHAFIGFHSATDTFKQWEPFYGMLQGTFNGHGAQVPADLIAADLAHPANAGIGEKWDLKQEEIYLIKNHDRTKARALWYLRHHPNKPEEAGYFPVAWNRMHGQGRVFYTSLGHREDLWDDSAELKGRVNSIETSKKFQQHALGGIKWALGLAEGSVTPNPEVK